MFSRDKAIFVLIVKEKNYVRRLTSSIEVTLHCEVVSFVSNTGRILRIGKLKSQLQVIGGILQL